MNPIKRAVSSTVTFVSAHKLPIAVVTTAVTTAYVVKKTMGNQLANAEAFITEEGLYDKFMNTFYSDDI